MLRQAKLVGVRRSYTCHHNGGWLNDVCCTRHPSISLHACGSIGGTQQTGYSQAKKSRCWPLGGNGLNSKVRSAKMELSLTAAV
jgi:hypothetical protein